MAKLKKKKTKKKNLQEAGFLLYFKNFKKHIEGLEKAIGLSMLVATTIHRKETERVSKFIDEKGKGVKKVGDIREFKLEIQDQSKYEDLVGEEEKTKVAIKLIPRSIFVSLVSQFDLLVANIMREVLIKHPASVPKDRSLTFEEISRFRSLKEIEQFFIEDEIDRVLRGSHEGQIEWFEKRIDRNLRDSLVNQWSVFIELTERRNLFVHADGIVNDQYLRNCREGECVLEKIKKGDILEVNPKYLEDVFRCLFEISSKLTWLIWRKIEEKDIETIDNFFNTNVGVELIKTGDYALAENLFSFFIKNSSGSKDLTKTVFLINLALINKLNGNLSETESLLNSKDWSGCKNELQMAVHILRNQHNEALDLMEKIGSKSDIIGKESYESDPIYKDLRGMKKFKRIFKKIFKEELVLNEDENIKGDESKKTKISSES